MQSRQPIGIWHLVVVVHGEHRLAVRFRPDQRVTAKAKLIKLCFCVGYVIPFNHAAFAEIDARTWETATK